MAEDQKFPPKADPRQRRGSQKAAPQAENIKNKSILVVEDPSTRTHFIRLVRGETLYY